MLRRKQLSILLLAILLLLAASFIYSRFSLENEPAQSPPANQSVNQDKAEDRQEKPPFINLQPIVDSWATRHSGSTSVVVYDLNNKKQAASLMPDKQYFAASLYKLYVAYVGYQKVADGTYNLNEPYVNDWTRGKCLDEMIRTSHSPCAEKMWVELGKENITGRMDDYGLTNTSLTGLYTSAGDAAVILQHLHAGKDLTNDHRAKFLASMKNQIYRDTLIKGFSDATVYNKVGFRGNNEYHDTAIVKFDNGRSYVVSVLTDGVGTAGIIDLASRLQKVIGSSE